MSGVDDSNQVQPGSSVADEALSLAEVLASLMVENGYDPKNNAHYKLLARRTGLQSEATIRFILNGQTKRPHLKTLEKLIKQLCPDRPGSADLLRIAASRPPHHTPPK